MRRPVPREFFIDCLLCLITLVWLSPGHAADLQIAGRHPVELSSKPACTACHTADTEIGGKPISVYNHESDWVSVHRFYATKNTPVCNQCHRVSFCTECHAYKEELKPSDKLSEKAERWLPHRGDYIFQHRIDGRVDPTSCFRCHGRQNNHVCRRCHK